MTQIRKSLRQHLPFLVIMPLILIALTWPTIIRVFDRDGFWLVNSNIDAHMLFWDAWYFERVITGQADYYFTDLLFHPTGVSLAFHNFSLPHMALMAALKTILPPANAYNLTYLLLAFLNAAAGYLYLHYLFRDKWIALFGAVVFGTSAFIIFRPAHTNIAFIATIPLSLYFLHRGLLEGRPRFLLSAAAAIGITAFIGMYTLVCLLIMLGFYLIYFALKNWKYGRFWLNLCLLLMVLAGFLFLRFYPMLADPQGLSGALAKNEGRETGDDLVFNFVNFHHPVTSPIVAGLLPQLMTNDGWENVVFLGYIPLLLVVLAFVKGESRRPLLPWLILALPFLALRLGSYLSINDTTHSNIILPKYYLTEALPVLFKPFWATDNFHAGVLLPFAALSCFGLLTFARLIPARRRQLVILPLICLTAFEYYQQQLPFVLPQGRLDFIEWLKQEEEAKPIRLINLPTGASNSKVYAFYQTFNGYPHAEGRPTRAPLSAFDYMEANLLLRNWRSGKTYNCLPGNTDEFIAAQAQLLSDGFTHIVLHRDRIHREKIASNFINIPAAYRDQYVSVYRVEDLDESCNIPALRHQDAISLFKTIKETAVFPLHQFSLLSIRPQASADKESLGDASAFLRSLREITLLPEVPPYDEASQAALASNAVILLVYNPETTAVDLIETYRAWLARHFNSCGRVADAGTAVIEYFLRQGYPCELALSAAPLAIDYANGVQLGNLLADARADKLELHFLWKRLPNEAHAFSVQLFDDNGDKVHNQDFVFHRDALGKYEIDLSNLTPETYRAKLIVYNYDSGVSVSGFALSSQTRFDREFEFGRFRLAS